MTLGLQNGGGRGVVWEKKYEQGLPEGTKRNEVLGKIIDDGGERTHIC